jgi:hypothetical protein
LPSLPPQRRAPGTQLPVHAPAVQRKGQGPSAAAVHAPALEQRIGFSPSHFFASGTHAAASAASPAAFDPLSIPIEASGLASPAPP